MKKNLRLAAIVIALFAPLSSFAFDLMPYAEEVGSSQELSKRWFKEGVLMVYSNSDDTSARAGFQLIERSSKVGMSHALGAMGLFHEQGLFVKKDLNLAKKYYEDAVSAGSPIGFYGMARVYENGYGGVQASLSDRNFWLRKGADASNKESVFGLAVALEQGQGLTINHRAAARHYLKACNQRMLEACYNLGIKLAKGIDLPQSYTNALALLLYAQDNGFEPAKLAVEGFIRHVPDPELKKAILNASKMTKSKTAEALDLSF